MKSIFSDYPSLLKVSAELNKLLDEVHFLRSEVDRLEYYEKEYHNLLDRDVQHASTMMDNMVSALIDNVDKINKIGNE